ncbi:MAG: nucleotidyl transferase AbiEii/AbiGii toxin family protein [Muribaculaceae bacterium]|nr:nucleotidyl transferase AbiEii/AbiGii toxin family protein [Muribaculaceae bacterium]
MNLHDNRKLFTDAVLATAQHLDINPIFVEKDYWITRSLKLMSKADPNGRAIFKGGTSLSKAYFIGSRFSEDIDVAIVNADLLNGNQRKSLIKRLAKSATVGLKEIVTPGVTSKGSSYYKAIYGYSQLPELTEPIEGIPIRPGQIMLEINSFANPYPFVNCSIGNFIGEFLKRTYNDSMIEEYGLEEFKMNVLDKKRTATEKIVSLFRYSLAKDYEQELAKKIRHFYDLYFLMEDSECFEYFYSQEFISDLSSLLDHDREMFDKPDGWNTRSIMDSPLFKSLDEVWERSLSTLYEKELSALAYKPIPPAKSVIENVASIIGEIRKFPSN